METKSQLRLRSLDVGGRPIGTDRLSLVQTNGTDFLSKLNQGLADVQQEEARNRRLADQKTSERADERSAQVPHQARVLPGDKRTQDGHEVCVGPDDHPRQGIGSSGSGACGDPVHLRWCDL